MSFVFYSFFLVKEKLLFKKEKRKSIHYFKKKRLMLQFIKVNLDFNSDIQYFTILQCKLLTLHLAKVCVIFSNFAKALVFW